MGRCSKSQSPERLDSSLGRRRDELGYQFLIYALIELDSCQESLETGDAYAARINGSRGDKSKARKSDPLTRSTTQIEREFRSRVSSTRLFPPFYSIRSKESGIRMPRYARRDRKTFFFFFNLISSFHKFKWQELSEGQLEDQSPPLEE